MAAPVSSVVGRWTALCWMAVIVLVKGKQRGDWTTGSRDAPNPLLSVGRKWSSLERLQHPLSFTCSPSKASDGSPGFKMMLATHGTGHCTQLENTYIPLCPHIAQNLFCLALFSELLFEKKTIWFLLEHIWRLISFLVFYYIWQRSHALFLRAIKT